mgnify:FL=1
MRRKSEKVIIQKSDRIKETRHLLPFLILSITLYLISENVFSQHPCNVLVRDTLKLCQGTVVELDGTRFLLNKDTLIIGQKSKSVRIISDPIHQRTTLYDTLRAKAYRQGKWTGKFFDLLIKSGNTDLLNNRDLTKNPDKRENLYREYKGYKIRDIYFYRLEAFGPEIGNPTLKPESSIASLANRLHKVSREQLIRKNLFIKKGDKIDPELMETQAALIRDLPYFKDVEILVVPTEDIEGYADLIVITKDLFPFGIDIKIYKPTKFDLGIFNRNFLGYGHNLEVSARMNFDQGTPVTLGSAYYQIKNIGGTFIDLDARLDRDIYQSTYTVSAARDFTNTTKNTIGGVEFGHYVLKQNNYQTEVSSVDLKYNTQSIWLGRSIDLKINDMTMKIALTGAINNRIYTVRPYTTEKNSLYENRNMLLMALDFWRSRYITDRYIYQFGSTEDVNIGYSLRLLAGKEQTEFNVRKYTQATMRFGFMAAKYGYFSISAACDTYWNEKETEQGMVQIQGGYISPLQRFGPYFIRHFLNTDFTRGFNRLPGEKINSVNWLGVSGINSSDTIYFAGDSRFAFNFASVIYTPLYLYGFRVAGFTYFHGAWIGGRIPPLEDNVFNTGFGFGFFIRNENLVLQTIKFRIGFYPELPEQRKCIIFEFKGISMLRLPTFRPTVPKVLHYI